MNLSELVAAYGDDKIKLQNLDQCSTTLNMKGGSTYITFGTDVKLGLDGPEKLGLVVWFDRDRVQEIIASAKAK